MHVATCQVVSGSSHDLSDGRRHALGNVRCQDIDRVCRIVGLQGGVYVCKTMSGTHAVAVFASVVCHTFLVRAARGSGCQVVRGGWHVIVDQSPWQHGVRSLVCHGLGLEARTSVGWHRGRVRGSTRHGSHRQKLLQNGWLAGWACPKKA